MGNSGQNGVHVSHEIMEKALKCGICWRFLNVGPIVFNENIGAGICGRCQTGLSLDTVQSIPQLVYEELASCLTFPCSYKKNGCEDILTFDQVMKHERNCRFRDVICPLFCNKLFPQETCCWKGTTQTIHDHLLTHWEYFLYPPQFEWPENGRNIIFFTKIGPHIVTVIIKYETESKFLCLVLLDGTDLGSQCFKYQLELSDDDKVNSMILRRDRLESLPNFLDDLRTPGHTLKVDIAKVSEMLQHPKKIHARLGIVKKNRKQVLELTGGEIPDVFPPARKPEVDPSIDEAILAEVECCVCNEFMVPPIFICPIGHSLCSACKKKLKVCPTCKFSLGNGRNFTLEKLTAKLNYPCTNRQFGCKFVTTSDKIRQHQNVCNLSESLCIFRCGWKARLAGLSSHLKEKHKLRLISNNCTLKRCIDTPVLNDFYFATFDNQLFILEIKHSPRSAGLSFNIFHVGQSTSQVFKYHLQLGMGEKHSCPCLEISNLCQNWRPQLEQTDTRAYVNIPRALLATYVDASNQYCLKVSISKM